MIKTHSYEDRQSLLETGWENTKNKIIITIIIIKTERDRRRGWVGQRRAEMSGVDGGAVGVRGGVCVLVCVSVCCVLSGDVYVCIHVAEVRRN